MNTTQTRKMKPDGFPATFFECSECFYKLERPKRGPFGWTNSKAIIAQAYMAFDKHKCENYDSQCMQCGRVMRGHVYQLCKRCRGRTH